MTISEKSNHPAIDYLKWENILKNEIIPEGIHSGKIRLLSAEEIATSPCQVASGAPRNISGTHASKDYPGGRTGWIKAFECWFKKMTYDSLIGTLRRPYQHASRLGKKLPSYRELPGRKFEAEELNIFCWPEHYGLTIWRRPAFEISIEDWEDILRMLAAEIKFRKARGSGNPYEDAHAPNPIERIRDWKAVVDLSKKLVLNLSDPWKRQNWIKCASNAIWSINRLSDPRARILSKSNNWEVLPDIMVPSPSPFNNQLTVHQEIERVFLNSVESYDEIQRRNLNRVIKQGENILIWWEQLCSIDYSELKAQSEIIGELWKDAENKIRNALGIPGIGMGWISEIKLLNLIKESFPNESVIHHARHKWLGRQHLDIFLPNRNIAIEYQGEQHFVPVDSFGGWEGLYKTQIRDKRKLELCSKNNIKLIYFRFDELVTKELVKERIKKNIS